MNPQHGAPRGRKNEFIAGGAVVAVIVIVAVAMLAFKPSETAPTATQPTPTTPSNPQQPSGQKTTYKNGTYNDTGQYTSPGGTEKVNLTVTLTNDKITDATVTTSPATPTSEGFQAQFIGNFKSQVIGKNIEDVQLSQVSGSSLTSGGFNEALDKIQAQARA